MSRAVGEAGPHAREVGRDRRDPVEVRPVRGRRELMTFIRLPWRLYQGAANWVPPLISERKRFLDKRRNAFFARAEAEYFPAWRDRTPVGRITAHINHRFNEFQNHRSGMFGFIECEHAQDTADALLAAAEQWLRQRDRDRLIGPFDFTTNHECGVLVEGFEHLPQILENSTRPGHTNGGLSRSAMPSGCLTSMRPRRSRARLGSSSGGRRSRTHRLLGDPADTLGYGGISRRR